MKWAPTRILALVFISVLMLGEARTSIAETPPLLVLARADSKKAPTPAPLAPAAPLAPTRLELALAKVWDRGGVKPAGPVSGAHWLRRVALDLTGQLPLETHRKRLAAGDEPAVRGAIVDEMLDSPRFSQRWGALLTNPLFGAEREHRVLRGRVETYMTDGLARGVGLDKLARGLLVAEGSVEESPAVGFLQQFVEDKSQLAARVGSVFLGVRVACAQCHDHPFGRWSMQDYYGLGAWFSRLRTVYLPRELYRAYREGRTGRLGQVDIVVPRNAKGQVDQAFVKRLVEGLKVLNRRPIAGDSPRGATRPVNVEMVGRYAAGRVRAPKGPEESDAMTPSMGSDSGGSAGEMADQEAPLARKAPPVVRTRMVDVKDSVLVLVEDGKAEMVVPDLVATRAAPTTTGTSSSAVLTVSLKAGQRIPPRLPGRGPSVAVSPGDKGPTAPGGSARKTPIKVASNGDPGERRDALARWLVAPENPYFARALANRIWAHLYGRGLVEPLDGLEDAATGPLAEVLDAVARDLGDVEFDLAAFLRRQVLSSRYALAPSSDEKVRDLFASFRPRSLDSGQLSGALGLALGLEGTTLQSLSRRLEKVDETDGAQVDEASSTSPRGAGIEAALLWLAQGPLHQGLETSPLVKAVAALGPAEQLEQVTRRLLGRDSTEDEKKAWLAHCARRAGRDAVIDLLWAQTATTEFRTVH